MATVWRPDHNSRLTVERSIVLRKRFDTRDSTDYKVNSIGLDSMNANALRRLMDAVCLCLFVSPVRRRLLMKAISFGSIHPV